MNQLTIEHAIEAGESTAAMVNQHAQQRDPLFSHKAEQAILRHLQACERCQAPGEDLVDIARAHGAVPHDDRAFGQVFRGMARRGLIRTVGFALRKKGHGTAGGRIWGLCL